MHSPICLVPSLITKFALQRAEAKGADGQETGTPQAGSFHERPSEVARKATHKKMDSY